MINFSNVSFNYPKKEVFKNLSFELPKGSVCGLLGENGTGKTTLLNLMIGTLFPKEGLILVDEMNTKSRLAEMYQNLYFIPEEFQLPAITLARFIQAYAPFYPHFSHERVLDYTERLKVGFDERLDRMSMGQRKKALIAFGFATSCPILLLDEPTNGLDIPSKSVFRAMVAELANEDRIIVISSHQIRDLDMLLDRVMILDEHDLVLNSSIAEVEEKLYFGNKHEMDTMIYSTGAFAVRENINAEESTANIELLFNALIENKELFKQIFNK